VICCYRSLFLLFLLAVFARCYFAVFCTAGFKKPEVLRLSEVRGCIFPALSAVNCTPSVRQENEDRLTGADCARMNDGRTLARSAKRKRALLGSNPPRNSRPETHGDAAGADG
jgi:hypothetical protein